VALQSGRQNGLLHGARKQNNRIEHEHAQPLSRRWLGKRKIIEALLITVFARPSIWTWLAAFAGFRACRTGRNHGEQDARRQAAPAGPAARLRVRS
jgi:hypothetical protein